MTISTEFHLTKYKSFGATGVKLTSIKPVNVIIGRNNIGKSALLHALDFLCKDGQNKPEMGASIEITQAISEGSLKQVFQTNTSGGDLGGRHWDDHGAKFVNAQVTWKEIGLNQIEFLRINMPASDAELRHISSARYGINLRHFKHVKLDADRDITPEGIDNELSLSSDGVGATNIIHKYLQHVGFDRSLIQKTLLVALNNIFSPDIIFDEITTRFHETNNRWEIFLGEASKGPVALSASGSGLKTVILTLLNLLIRPNFEKTSIAHYIFSLEELENNLHPALQRNLFAYIEDFATRNGCHFFLTTHSNVAIDIFGNSEQSQIVHVVKGEDGVIGTAYTGDSVGHGVLDDLGVRASDLLQANGLIWVEGPSDRVFLKKWISLWSDGELNEGRHYQFVFYGGSVLANINAELSEHETKDAISAFQINRNFIFVCDSDRKSPSGSLKPRVAKLIQDVASTRALVWATRCKEIENYIPKESFDQAHEKQGLPNIGEYEPIQDYLRCNKISRAKAYTDKHSKAYAYADVMTKENLSFRPELEEQLTAIVAKIRAWNR